MTPHPSAAACINALRRAGFDARLDGPDHVIIERDEVLIARVRHHPAYGRCDPLAQFMEYLL